MPRLVIVGCRWGDGLSDDSDGPRTALDWRAVDGRVLRERILCCEACRLVWLPADDGRWRAYWLDDGPEDKLLFHCPDCAEREFGVGA